MPDNVEKCEWKLECIMLMKEFVESVQLHVHGSY